MFAVPLPCQVRLYLRAIPGSLPQHMKKSTAILVIAKPWNGARALSSQACFSPASSRPMRCLLLSNFVLSLAVWKDSELNLVLSASL